MSDLNQAFSTSSNSWTTKVTRGTTTLSQSDGVGAEMVLTGELDRPVKGSSRKGLDGWRQPTAFYAYEESYGLPVTGGATMTSTYMPTEPDTKYNYAFSGSLATVASGAYGAMWAVPWTRLPHLPVANGIIGAALNKALLEVKDQSLNISVAMAEARESVALLTTSVSKLARAYIAVKRGNFANAAKVLGVRRVPNTKDQSKAWLQLQLGWVPLLSDISSAYALATKAAQAITLTGKGVAKITHKNSVDYGNIVNTRWNVLVESEVVEEAFVRLDYVLDNIDAHYQASLGFSNPAEVFWEVIPLSFVWDYFNPVGEFLATLDASKGLRFRDGSLSTRRTVDELHRFTAYLPPAAPGWTHHVTGSATGTKHRKDVVRSVYESDPMGSLYFRNPFSSVKRVLNLLALARTYK